MKLTLQINETIVLSTNVSNPDSCGYCVRQAVDHDCQPICQLFPCVLVEDHGYGFPVRSAECHAHEIKRTLPTPPDPYISGSKLL